MKKQLLILFTMIMGVGPAFSAQDTTRFSLNDAVDYALQNSVKVRKSMLDKESAEHQIGEIRSQGLPQISGSGQLQVYPNIPTQLLPGAIVGEPGTQIPVQFGTKYNLDAGFSASQILYDQGFFTGLKAAKSSRELYKLLNIRSREDVIANVSKAFYQVLELKARTEILKNNLNRLKELSDITKTQYQNDLVTETEYNRVKVNEANLSTRLASAKTARQQQLNYLKVLMGMPVSTALELTEPAGFEDVSLNILKKGKDRRIELEILEKQKALRVLDKKGVAAGYFPKLSAFGQQTWQAQREEFNFFDADETWFQQTVVGLKLQVPIFDGLRKHHQVEQKKIAIKKQELEISNTRRSLDMQLENARAQLRNSLSSVQAQKENKQLAQKVYDQTQLRYKEQVANLTDLLDAESDFREAKTNYYREVVKFKIAQVNLLQAQGRIDELTHETQQQP